MSDVLRRALVALALVGCTLPPAALAQSTINPAAPAQNAPLASAPVRQNFAASYNDINGILNMHAGSVAPGSALVGEDWLNTGTNPATWSKRYNSGWGSIGTFNLSTGVFTPNLSTLNFANPTAQCGPTVVNGSALTAMRSDGACAVNQSANYTMTGLWAFQNAVTISVNNVLSGTFAGTQGLNINSAVSGSQSGGGVGFNGNIISVNSDNAAMTNGTFYNTLALQDNLNGALASGGRQVLQAILTQTMATVATSTNRNYVGIFGRGETTSGDGGSATNLGQTGCNGTGPVYCGGWFGGGFAANADLDSASAVYGLALEAVELNWRIKNAQAVNPHFKFKVGLSLAAFSDDQYHADVGEAMISLGGQGGVAMNGGVMVTDWNGPVPFGSATTIYGAHYAGAMTVANVLDFVDNAGGGSLACTGKALGLPNMVADCSGNLTLGSTTVSTVAGYSVLSINNASTGGLIDLKANGTLELRIQGFASQGVITATAGPLVIGAGNVQVAEFGSTGCLFIGLSPTSCGTNTLQISSPVTGASKGFLMTGTASGVPTQDPNTTTGIGWGFNSIYVTDAGIDTSSFASGSQNSAGLFVQYLASGGSGTKGNNAAIYGSYTIATQPVVGITNLLANYQAGQFIGQAKANLRGTNTGAGAIGSIFGIGASAIAQSGATFLLNVSNELNAAIQTGASAKSFSVLALAQLDTHAISGVTYDTSLSISAISGAIGVGTGILFSDYNGAQPIKTTGSLLSTQGTATVANGIDLSNSSYTFSGCTFKSTGFCVANAGAVNLASLTTSGTISTTNTTASVSTATGALIVGSGAAGGLGVGGDVWIGGSVHVAGNYSSGAWQGTVIDSTYGGTGVNNAGRTLTVNTNGGTLAFAGASTVMTFPTTSATIARTDAGQTFTGTQAFGAITTAAITATGKIGVTSSDTGNANFASITASDTNNGAGTSFNTNAISILAGPAIGNASGQMAASWNSSTNNGFLVALAPGSAWRTFNISGGPLNLNKESGGSIVLWGALSSGSSVTFSGLASDATHTDNTVCADSSTGLLYKGSGTLGICLGTSGRQFKTAFEPMQAGLDEVMRINLWNYRYRSGFGDGGARMQYGPTAQDVALVLPDLVHYGSDGEAINYDIGAFLPIALHAIQQIKADNDNLRAELRALGSRR